MDDEIDARISRSKIMPLSEYERKIAVFDHIFFWPEKSVIFSLIVPSHQRKVIEKLRDRQG